MNKMKKIGVIGVIALLSAGCNGDNVPDCFQNAGELIQETLEIGWSLETPIIAISSGTMASQK
jgi:PBP1b-binding outer membrane lipoprotein LpoB